MLRAALGLEPDDDVGDPIIEAGEAPEEVDGEGSGGTLDVDRQLVGPRCRLQPDVFDLLQQVAHRQDLVLMAAHRPRAHAGDLLQMMSVERGDCDAASNLFFFPSHTTHPNTLYCLRVVLFCLFLTE